MTLIDRIFLAWRIVRARPGNLLKHAERELGTPDDSYSAAGVEALKELILVFSTQGHSGFSASYVRHQLALLLAYEPIRPLTGEPSEWIEVGDGVFQNNRCSRVFKQADRFDGQPYDLDGKVFREPNGSCFTNRESMVPITFPYTPTTVYVDVTAAA